MQDHLGTRPYRSRSNGMRGETQEGGEQSQVIQGGTRVTMISGTRGGKGCVMYIHPEQVTLDLMTGRSIFKFSKGFGDSGKKDTEKVGNQKSDHKIRIIG